MALFVSRKDAPPAVVTWSSASMSKMSVFTASASDAHVYHYWLDISGGWKLEALGGSCAKAPLGTS